MRFVVAVALSWCEDEAEDWTVTAKFELLETLVVVVSCCNATAHGPRAPATARATPKGWAVYASTYATDKRARHAVAAVLVAGAQQPAYHQFHSASPRLLVAAPGPAQSAMSGMQNYQTTSTVQKYLRYKKVTVTFLILLPQTGSYSAMTFLF